MLILTGCASSGGIPAPVETKVEAPPVPADLRICLLARKIPRPPPGELTRARAFQLVADLKGSEGGKTRCGLRLICWYEDWSAKLAGKSNDDRVCETLKKAKR